MNIHTTCQACRRILLVPGGADHPVRTHPECPAPPDAAADLDRIYLEHLLAGRDREADDLAAIIDRPGPPPAFLDAALAYAGWGWPVLPLAPGRKVPATPHGFKDATTDTGQIRGWWAEQPTANIGVPTGICFDVVDVDAPTGWRAYGAMLDADVIPDVHGVVATAGAGLHLYLAPTGDAGNLAGILPGIDYRGAGGYVVVPPSVNAAGHRYQWRHEPSPAITRPGVPA